MNQARFDFEPLAQAAGSPSGLALARRLGVTDRTIWRWKAEGLSDHQADRAACALGRHPVSVWPDWYTQTANFDAIETVAS